MQRVDAGENIAESFDYSQAPVDDISSEEKSDEEKSEQLAEIICGANSNSAGALLVLMRTLENSTHAKLLANRAKHFAFTYCAELDLYGMLDAQIVVVEAELLNS